MFLGSNVKVSIGIPFYNPGPLFRLAIYSVLNQSYKNFELILIDDGSTDGSLELANSIQDDRVIVISDGLNRGLPSRLNQLIECSSGEYIARMDADDMMHSLRILKQVELLEGNDEIDITCTGVCSLSASNKVRGVRLLDDVNIDIDPVDILTGYSGICHPSVLARKSWFQRNKYNILNKRAEDAELWFSAIIKNDLKIKKINEPLHFYREESSISYDNLKRSYLTQMMMMRSFSKELSLFKPYVVIVKLFFKLIIVWFLHKFNLLKILIANKNNSTGESDCTSLQNEVNSILNK